MDKKNTTIGVLLLLAAFAIIYFSPKPAMPPPAPQPDPASPAVPAIGTAPGTVAAVPAPNPVNAAFAAVNAEAAEATITTLDNDFVEARFSDYGGALKEVALKKYSKELKGTTPYVFNEVRADPILAFVDLPGLDRNTRFERVSHSASEVVYRAVVDNRLEVTRRYVLAPNKAENSDPYQVRHETTFRNLTDQTLQPMRVALSLGTAAPNNENDAGLMLKTGLSNNGDQTFIPRSDLESSGGFLGIGARSSRPFIASGGPITWAAVKNQFFVSILTGDEPATGLITKRVKLFTALPDDAHNAYGITGAAQFDLKGMEPKGEAKLAGSLYVGPKEYRRLANTSVFKSDQDKIMDFGFFKFFSQILLTLMTWIHGWAGNWGVAIILTTLILKTIFIPFTLAASRSAKRMAKLQPELQAIREKYKDNPQKQQQATMEMFKERRINPIGGCFPILLTIPFFMGFFTMLQSTAELRFSPFLWAPDLAATDTVAVIFGVLPLNIMPLLMGATMIIQMHLTPSPSVDNMQMKMMKIMPYIFTLFCYTFPAALSLYSFVNGLFSIGQQLVINRMKDPEEKPAAKPAFVGGKVVKNVTPGKKK